MQLSQTVSQHVFEPCFSCIAAQSLREDDTSPKMDAAAVSAALGEALSAAGVPALDEAVHSYVVSLAGILIASRAFEASQWNKGLGPYLETPLSKKEAATVIKGLCDRCTPHDSSDDDDDDDGEGEELCHCKFSLAYGGKILLNNAVMRLKRGRRYGLCGANGAGKSTLMKSIAAGKVEGFPPPDQLRTVYVEHDIQGSVEDLSVVQFVMADPLLAGNAEGDVAAVLGSVGFTPEMQAMPITSLSGGWKMKLALARAQMMKADILLLDEPTNHVSSTSSAVLLSLAFVKGTKPVD